MMPTSVSDPTDCDIMFVYLGNNNFHEVKIHSTPQDQATSTTKFNRDSDKDWKNIWKMKDFPKCYNMRQNPYTSPLH